MQVSIAAHNICINLSPIALYIYMRVSLTIADIADATVIKLHTHAGIPIRAV